MTRKFFLQTPRLVFSSWAPSDQDLATLLWGNPAVTKYICATGRFTAEEIQARLSLEISNKETYGIQYWPIFERSTSEFIGCCGLRPRSENCYEIGFHLRPEFWGKGYAKEAATEVIRYAFEELHAEKLFAGHNPKNTASQKVLLSLGMKYIGDEFYAPTGLYHPSYEMVKIEK